MHRTKHFDQRCSQRGIKQSHIQLALDYGDQQQDRFILGRKEIDERLAEIEKESKALKHARDKGGVVVVADGNSLITTYKVSKRRTH